MSKTVNDTSLEAKMCFGAYRLNRSVARFYQAVFADTGLTYPKYIVLKVLSEFGPQSITELSEKAGVETNTLSPLLKRMADYGTITRVRDPKDERRIVLTLTDFGQSALFVASQAAENGFRKLGFDPKDIEKLMILMSTVQDRLTDADPEPLDVSELAKDRK